MLGGSQFLFYGWFFSFWNNDEATMIPSRPGFSTVRRAVRMMPCVRGGGGGETPNFQKAPHCCVKGGKDIQDSFSMR